MNKFKSKRKYDAELSQQLIIKAAIQEFSEKGFDGARIDKIAKNVSLNKQLIYYYFENKITLFKSALNFIHSDFRSREKEIRVDELPAIEAILALIDFTWNYFVAHPEYLCLVNRENQMKKCYASDGAYLNHSWISISSDLISRGIIENAIRPTIDFMHLNINILALETYFLINLSNLSSIYEKPLGEELYLNERLDNIKDMISSWIRKV